MPDPERPPARFSASAEIAGRRVGFSLSDRAAKALAGVMALCTLLVAAEALAGVAWLVARMT